MIYYSILLYTVVYCITLLYTIIYYSTHYKALISKKGAI